ncbi:MAG: CapA family protein [Armatimonadota bacterium]|nr:CapA family protein [Armatimonadota bacterium]
MTGGTAAVADVEQTLPAEAQEPPQPRSFTIAAVGDVMLDRSVWKRVQANGPKSIFEPVREDLQAADICFANLECPLSTVGPHSPREHLLFRADPAAVEVLVDGGVDVVALANNHTLNAGEAGLKQTIEHLEGAGVAYCGAAQEPDRAWEPCIFDVEGLLLGFIACTDLSFEHGSWCKVDDELTELAEHVRAAAEQCDLLVVSAHWGNEYQRVPTQRQRDVARAAAEAGADLIIGHHPHVLQGVGRHGDTPILYSCGNLVFDQREGERMESAIFHLRFTEGEGWHIRMVPVWIPRSRCGPIYPESARAATIINRLATLSGNLGVPVMLRDNEGEATVPLREAEGAARSRKESKTDQRTATSAAG